MTDITDDELQRRVIEADEEAFKEDVEPKQRVFPVIFKVMNRLGRKDYALAGVGIDPLVDRIHDIHAGLYRPSDLAMGGIHGGIFMFRDVFARVHVPHMYGMVAIDPFKLTDLTDIQLGWLASRPDDMSAFFDQFIDIFDFAGGIGNLADFKTPSADSLNLFHLAAFQLQAAAASLTAAFDIRGAIQSALIGTELALKAGLAAAGVDEAGRKTHGHNLVSSATDLHSHYPNFDLDRVTRVVAKLPPYVGNRYSPVQPDRVETGHIVMGAQYIAGEAMRQATAHSIRQGLSPPVRRNYPP